MDSGIMAQKWEVLILLGSRKWIWGLPVQSKRIGGCCVKHTHLCLYFLADSGWIQPSIPGEGFIRDLIWWREWTNWGGSICAYSFTHEVCIVVFVLLSLAFVIAKQGEIFGPNILSWLFLCFCSYIIVICNYRIWFTCRLNNSAFN